MKISNFSCSLFIILIFTSLVSVEVLGESEREASSLIDEAEKSVVSAYNGILDAEKAGADVGLLSSMLNNACDFLVQARVYYGYGEFEDAKYYAGLSINLCGKVEVEADYLKDAAEVRSFWGLRINITYAISAVILIICFFYLSWEVFRKRYIRESLSKRPMLASGED